MTRQRWRLGALALPALAAVLLFAAPASAGSCPDDASGPVDKAVYALNENIEFFGNYTDFADPGTVTITFTRPADGATYIFEAFNLPDGAWMRTVTFTSREDVGTWDVTVSLVETSQTATCTDRVRITATGAGRTPAPGVTMPPTSTVEGPSRAGTPAMPAAALATIALAAALAFGVVLARQVRHAPPGA